MVDTYHDQLNGEVGALGTNVGNVAARLKEALPVAASLRAGHLWKRNYINLNVSFRSCRPEQRKYRPLTQTDFLGS